MNAVTFIRKIKGNFLYVLCLLRCQILCLCRALFIGIAFHKFFPSFRNNLGKMLSFSLIIPFEAWNGFWCSTQKAHSQRTDFALKIYIYAYDFVSQHICWEYIYFSSVYRVKEQRKKQTCCSIVRLVYFIYKQLELFAAFSQTKQKRKMGEKTEKKLCFTFTKLNSNQNYFVAQQRASNRTQLCNMPIYIECFFVGLHWINNISEREE